MAPQSHGAPRLTTRARRSSGGGAGRGTLVPSTILVVESSGRARRPHFATLIPGGYQDG